MLRPLGMVKIETDDLIDSHGVAEVLLLKAGHKAVSVYRSRYVDFPAPVVNLGAGRCLLWRRQDIQKWAKARAER
jgi:hypothetical protein